MRNIIRILHERISDLNKKFRDICDPLPPSKPEYADNLQQESGSDQYVQIGNTISHVDGSQIRDDEIYRGFYAKSDYRFLPIRDYPKCKTGWIKHKALPLTPLAREYLDILIEKAAHVD